MTFEDDGMDWFDADVESSIDPKEAAIDAVGTSARLSLFNVVLEAFRSANKDQKLSRAAIARELRIAPQAVSRLLRSPTNMTVETAARLLFVMGRELRFKCTRAVSRDARSARLHLWNTQTTKRLVALSSTGIRSGHASAHYAGQIVCTIAMVENEDETEVWVSGVGGKDGIYHRAKPKVVSSAKLPTHRPESRSNWEPLNVH